eukprot:3141614-Prorocentrum_lima.AAC.1
MQFTQVRTEHQAQVPEVAEAQLRHTPCFSGEPALRRKELEVIRLTAGAGAVERDRLDPPL